MKCDVKELAGHLDKTSIPDVQRYSLHTEYSFTKRKLDSALIERYPALKESYKNVPRLWFSEEWAEEFAEFIFDLTDGHPDPEVIEIHPPFRDYCLDFDTFLDRYTVFEDIVLDNFPDTIITMENRAGAQYPTTFLMTTRRMISQYLWLIRLKDSSNKLSEQKQMLIERLFNFECPR